MKKIFLLAVIGLTAISFTLNSDHLAKPLLIDGYQIYVLSVPVDDFEKVGYIKTGITWSGHPDQLFNKMLKKAKNEYPTGDAIIIDNINLEQALVIKFK